MKTTAHTISIEIPLEEFEVGIGPEIRGPLYITVPELGPDGTYQGFAISNPTGKPLTEQDIEHYRIQRTEKAPKASVIEIFQNADGNICEQYRDGSDTIMFVKNLPNGLYMCFKPNSKDEPGYSSGDLWIGVKKYSVFDLAKINEFLSQYGEPQVYCEKVNGEQIGEKCTIQGPIDVKLSLERNEVVIPAGLFQDAYARIPLAELIEEFRGLSSFDFSSLNDITEESFLQILGNYGIYTFDGTGTMNLFMNRLRSSEDFANAIRATETTTVAPTVTPSFTPPPSQTATATPFSTQSSLTMPSTSETPTQSVDMPNSALPGILVGALLFILLAGGTYLANGRKFPVGPGQ